MTWLLRPFRLMVLQSKLNAVLRAEFEQKAMLACTWRERDRLQGLIRDLQRKPAPVVD